MQDSQHFPEKLEGLKWKFHSSNLSIKWNCDCFFTMKNINCQVLYFWVVIYPLLKKAVLHVKIIVFHAFFKNSIKLLKIKICKQTSRKT